MSMHSIAFFKGVFHRLERYERHISSVALVVGFVIDNLTLTRIDLWIDHIVIVAYIIVAVSSIIVVHLPKKGALISRVQPFAPLPMQFAFGGLFSSFFVFYSLNIIPPIPLALKEAGVYYSVTRTQDGNYILKGEPRAWYAFLKRPVLHISQGAPAYFYSAVFAPTELKTRIVHQWEFFDESRGMWIVSSRVQFAIVGGRDRGYRGYSFKTNVAPGFWRVSVETERGQLLGRRQFKLER